MTTSSITKNIISSLNCQSNWNWN